ncbi:hypothetical protein [Limnospira platensis]
MLAVKMRSLWLGELLAVKMRSLCWGEFWGLTVAFTTSDEVSLWS